MLTAQDYYSPAHPLRWLHAQVKVVSESNYFDVFLTRSCVQLTDSSCEVMDVAILANLGLFRCYHYVAKTLCLFRLKTSNPLPYLLRPKPKEPKYSTIAPSYSTAPSQLSTPASTLSREEQCTDDDDPGPALDGIGANTNATRSPAFTPPREPEEQSHVPVAAGTTYIHGLLFLSPSHT